MPKTRRDSPMSFRNRRKIFIGIIVFIVFICTSITAFAFRSGSCGPNLKWNIDMDNLLTISGTGEMTSHPWGSYGYNRVIIEEGVTSIDHDAFYNNEKLTSVTLPSSLTTIGAYAFWRCEKLDNIIIPSGVSYIGEYAFADCDSLKSITIPAGINRIKYDTFSGCVSLSAVSLPESLKEIEGMAFYACRSLASITLPNVTLIGDRAFEECDSLTSISIPESVTSLGNRVFQGCGNLTGINLPRGLTGIGEGLFMECSSLGSIDLPDGVKYIGDFAFLGCNNLKKLTMPQGVESVGNRAFAECSKLSTVSFSSALNKIGDEAFLNCDLINAKLYAKVKKIGRTAFDKSVIIYAPEGSYAAKWAEKNGYELVPGGREYSVTITSDKNGEASANIPCGKEGKTVKLKATPKEGYVFKEWKVLSGDVTISKNKFKIGTADVKIKAIFKKDSSSEGGSTEKVTISDNVYKIDSTKGIAVFIKPKKSSVKKLTIPDTVSHNGQEFKVTGISEKACYGLSKLTQVTIGENVEDIGKSAFCDCSSLKKVTIKTDKLSRSGFGQGCFKDTPDKVTYKLPDGKKKDYKKWLVKEGEASEKAKYK